MIVTVYRIVKLTYLPQCGQCEVNVDSVTANRGYKTDFDFNCLFASDEVMNFFLHLEDWCDSRGLLFDSDSGHL